MLHKLDHVPAGLLDLAATELHQVLPGPILMHLTGRNTRPMFVSVLLHGNEHTGWEALRKVLARYQTRMLPRAMSIFIGNVSAAQANMRFIEGQQDFNRIWGTSDESPAPLMQEIIQEMQTKQPFISIDIHNNTGKNPHYACVNVIDDQFLYLAHLFSRTMVYFVKPEGVQSMAFSKLCPAVTVECGLSGDEAGTQHVMEFIDGCMHLSEFPSRPFDRSAVDVYHTVGICKIPVENSVGFDEPDCDLSFAAEVEYWNFRELPIGTVLAHLKPGTDKAVIITDEAGVDVTHKFMTIEDNKLVTTAPCIPAMITKDLNAIRKDCFCYVMEAYPLA